MQRQDARTSIVSGGTWQADQPRLDDARIDLGERHALPHRLIRVEEEHTRRGVEAELSPARGAGVTAEAGTEVGPKVLQAAIDHGVRGRRGRVDGEASVGSGGEDCAGHAAASAGPVEERL